MNLQKEFRTLVLPIIRGLPFIVVLVVVAILLGKRAVKYSQVLYQASASIKLDNRDFGVQNFDLLNNGSGKPSFGNNFLTEVEVFKSKDILKKTFEKLNFDVSYFRRGKVKTMELYDNVPFVLDYTILDEKGQDKMYFLTYLGRDSFQISLQEKGGEHWQILEGDSLTIPGQITCSFRKNEVYLAANPSALMPGDCFAFRLNSIKGLMGGINGNNLFIKPLDKEIFVVKVYYQHEIPEKAALFVNALIDTYIEEDKTTKDQQAIGTLGFIDKELEEVEKRLLRTEMELASFRKAENIVNPTQETDAMLKEFSTLNQQRLSFDIQEVELRNVYDFLTTDQSLAGFSPDFKALNDEVLKSTYMNTKAMELERTELLSKYSETSVEVTTLNKKIKELKAYSLESIEKKMLNIADKRAELFQTINSLENRFKAFPDKERRLLSLERAFQMEEQTYRMLMKKKTELSVAQSSNISFHKVIDYAKVPTGTLAPNKGLLIGGAVLVALIVGIFISFVWNFFTARLVSVEELEERINLPLFAAIPSLKKGQESEVALLNLYTNLKEENLLRGGKILAITSVQQNEGKSTVAAGLAKLLSSYGIKTLLLDMDYASMHPTYLQNEKVKGIAEVIRERIAPHKVILDSEVGTADLLARGSMVPSAVQVCSPETGGALQQMRTAYDVILIDASPVINNDYGMATLQHADLNFLLFRKNKTYLRKLKKVQSRLKSFQINNVSVILNEFSSF